MNKKIIFSFIMFLIILLFCIESFASNINNSDASIELFDRPICEINLNNMGKLTKELTDFDSSKKEATLTLTISNYMQKETYTRPVEVFLILDDSNSMTKEYGSQTKIQYVAQTATAFVEELFDDFVNIKIGLISFSSIDPITNTSTSLGTEADAKLLLSLSDSEETVKNAINTYTQSKGPYTNIEAGLSIAESNFSTNSEAEKHIILISDGVPNISLDTENSLTYSGVNAQNTKNRLLQLQNKGFKISSILMNFNERAVTNPNAPKIADGSRHMTYGELASEIFGTATNPTAGNFYYINYENLTTILEENIYNTIVASVDNTLKNIIIKDYFPEEIVNNFNFNYIKTPNIGTVSHQIDKTDNSITWTIELLEESTSDYLSYKLTLKDQFDEAIANKEIPTNSNLYISYETSSKKEENSSEDFSKIKINYEPPAEIPSIVIPEDNTIAEDTMPQTGDNSFIYLVIALLVIVTFIITRIKLINKLKY